MSLREFKFRVKNHHSQLSSLTIIADKKKYEYHTYNTETDLHLKIVLRGLDKISDLEYIGNKLTSNKFHPIKVTRMYKQNKTSVPLVIIELPKSEFNIYNISTCCVLKTRVEPLRKSQFITQCYNCQQVRHSQLNCHDRPRCVKCAQFHPSYECTKPRTIETKCSNCSGPHLAN